ncbi:MAG: hypothetical protein CR986_00875 [Ignavibacteriae bacterium]|nr:MAG: hypothetical protein CR986_00875 [Ignavibacteriota bacterium]
MKLVIPNNIFATLFVLSIDENEKPEIEINDSALITLNLINSEENKIGLIPTLDLIDNRDLFVSGKLGIGFEGLLSNAYNYFGKNDNLNTIHLTGDITKNEVILNKIIFSERYGIEPEIKLDSSPKFDEAKNYLMVGNKNWEEDRYNKGLSFSEQIAEFLEFPYINFVFASKDEELMKEFNKKYQEINSRILTNLDENLSKISLNKSLNKIVKNEISSIYYDLTNHEIEAIDELFKLIFYHQIIEHLFDVKFVE